MIKFVILIVVCLLGYSCSTSQKTVLYSDTSRIENDLKKITQTQKSRNYRNPETLDSVAEYIFKELSKTCDTVYYQTFEVDGVEYRNVIGSMGVKKSERLVIGSHYDVAGEQDGADDNASGVAGMLELSRLLAKAPINYRIDFVAYTLEEPPFFRSTNMGSYVHAQSLFEQGVKLKGMICLEMIGYFNDAPNSQDYPVGFLKYFYGNKGNYITVVQKFGNGRFGRKVKRLMTRQNLLPTKSFKAPSFLTGVDFSDHRNYWKFNYHAVMITNTSFYRNKNYHETTDKIQTLDIKRMSFVLDEVFLTLKQL